MIAAAEQASVYFTGDEREIDVQIENDGLYVAVPVTIDLASCIKDEITTLRCEILPVRPPASIIANTVESFNQLVKSRASDRFAAEQSVDVLFTHIFDVTKIIPNNFASSVSPKKMSVAEIRSLFPTRSRVSVDKSEKVQVAKAAASRRDFILASSIRRDPGSVRDGAVPLDTAAALSATSNLVVGVGVQARSPTDPQQSRILAESLASQKIRIVLRTNLSKDQISGSEIRVIASTESAEAQVVVFRPDLASRASLASLPIRPPSVVGGFTSLGAANIRVTQVDEKADSVVVCYRPVKDLLFAVQGFQALDAPISCLPGQTVTVQVPVETSSIVRVHPAVSGTSSLIFASCVVNNQPRGKSRASSYPVASMITVSRTAGVAVTVIVKAEGIVSGIIRRRDLRTGIVTYVTKRPTAIESIAEYVDDTAADLSLSEYTVDLYRQNGDVIRDAASSLIKHTRPRNLVEATVTVTPNIAGNQTIAVKIEPTIKQNDVNFLIDYIKASGLEIPFQTDLETLRKSLLNCVKFDVVRYDLRTGESKFVGQTSSEIVDDIDDAKIVSKFLYTCEAFVRSPSQLTDVIADRANRPVGVNPDITRLGLHISKLDVDGRRTGGVQLSVARKNFSRSNFETGTMPADPAVDSFRDGKTGDVFTAIATVAPVLPSVTSAAVEIRNQRPVVTWSVSGDARLVDRFVVNATSSGTSWTAAVGSFPGAVQSFKIVDNNTYTLPRYISYSVYPVYLDGTTGDAATSNDVLLEKKREI